MEEAFHPVSVRIEDTLKSQDCWYERFEHEPVRTSEEAASVRTGYSQMQGAKSLIVKGRRPKEEKHFIMIVVQGSEQFDRKKLKTATGYDDVRFATPLEVDEITSGVLPGGVPPWGNLFNIPVYADKGIFTNETMIFNAGDRRVSIAMRTGDYRRLVDPAVVEIT